MDEDRPKKPGGHEIGMPLDRLSINELEARITLLEEEIARVRQAISDKDASRSAAEAVFKL